MKIIYAKPIIEKILNANAEAKAACKTIERIELSKEEKREFDKEASVILGWQPRLLDDVMFAGVVIRFTGELYGEAKI